MALDDNGIVMAKAVFALQFINDENKLTESSIELVSLNDASVD